MAEKIETIRMYKPDPAPGMPEYADIHPDEVKNMQSTGWMVDMEQEQEKEEPKKADMEQEQEKPKKGGKKGK